MPTSPTTWRARLSAVWRWRPLSSAAVEGGGASAPLSDRLRAAKAELDSRRALNHMERFQGARTRSDETGVRALRLAQAARRRRLGLPARRNQKAAENQKAIVARRRAVLVKYDISEWFYKEGLSTILAADREPDRYGDLLEWIDEGKVREANRERLRRQRAPRGPNDPHTKMGNVVGMLDQAIAGLQQIDSKQLDPTLWSKEWKPQLRQVWRDVQMYLRNQEAK